MQIAKESASCICREKENVGVTKPLLSALAWMCKMILRKSSAKKETKAKPNQPTNQPTKQTRMIQYLTGGL